MINITERMIAARDLAGLGMKNEALADGVNEIQRLRIGIFHLANHEPLDLLKPCEIQKLRTLLSSTNEEA